MGKPDKVMRAARVAPVATRQIQLALRACCSGLCITLRAQDSSRLRIQCFTEGEQKLRGSMGLVCASFLNNKRVAMEFKISTNRL